MKSFKEIYAELSENHSDDTVILTEKVAFLLEGKDGPNMRHPIKMIQSEYIVISPKMMKELGFLQMNKKGYHLLNPLNLENLIKIQGKQKSVSVSTSYKNSNELKVLMSKGITVGNSGIIVELKGNLLIGGNFDIYSEIDDTGRRWIPRRRLPLDMKFEYLRFVGETERKYMPQSKDKIIKNYDEMTGKQKAGFIKDVYDFTKTLFVKHKKAFLEGMYKKGSQEYDEYLMNEFKIQKVYIISDNVSIDDIPKTLRNKTEIIDFDELMKRIK